MAANNLPTPDGKIRHGLTGSTVHFACPACGERLHNPLSDAGRTDHCPQCGAAFVVPCEAEAAEVEAERARQSEEKKRAEIEAARRAQAAAVARAERVQADQVREGEVEREKRKRRKGDEPPGTFRIVGGIMVALSVVVAGDAIFSNVDGIVSTGDLGLAIGNAAFFVGGILFYTLGTLLRALYQIRDGG